MIRFEALEKTTVYSSTNSISAPNDCKAEIVRFIYDLLSKSYGAFVSHIILLVFTVVGMIIHDRKKEKVNE